MAFSFQSFVLFACLSTLTNIASTASGDKVPVLMWSNDESVSFPVTLAGHTVGQNDFKEQFLNRLLARNDVLTVAVFVQDKLTVNDISLNADVYGSSRHAGHLHHTKDLMSRLRSAFLSSVASPLSIVGDLETDFSGSKLVLNAPYALTGLSSTATAKRNLVIVPLPEEHGHSLEHVDEIINNVTAQLQQLPGHFVAIYTGKKNHEQTSLEQHSGRHLLDTKENSNSPNITGLVVDIPDTFLMYASRISLRRESLSSNWTDLSVEQTSWNVTSGDDCSNFQPNSTSTNSTCSITLSYLHEVDVSGENLTKLTFDMMYATSTGLQSGYWYLKSFALTYLNSSLETSTLVLNDDFVDWTPFKFSYHCHENPPIRAKKNNASEFQSDLTLRFSAFQVQAFIVGNGFGYYNDCVGFFTIPIWTAIICLAVLLSILFFGIIMLLNIKTMDRLDDPKGKTISVTVSD